MASPTIGGQASPVAELVMTAGTIARVLAIAVFVVLLPIIVVGGLWLAILVLAPDGPAFQNWPVSFAFLLGTVALAAGCVLAIRKLARGVRRTRWQEFE